MNNKINIYYKDGQLRKYKTVKSLLKYYLQCYINGDTPSKITVDKSVSI